MAFKKKPPQNNSARRRPQTQVRLGSGRVIIPGGEVSQAKATPKRSPKRRGVIKRAMEAISHPGREFGFTRREWRDVKRYVEPLDWRARRRLLTATKHVDYGMDVRRAVIQKPRASIKLVAELGTKGARALQVGGTDAVGLFDKQGERGIDLLIDSGHTVIGAEKAAGSKAIELTERYGPQVSRALSRAEGNLERTRRIVRILEKSPSPEAAADALDYAREKWPRTSDQRRMFEGMTIEEILEHEPDAARFLSRIGAGRGVQPHFARVIASNPKGVGIEFLKKFGWKGISGPTAVLGGDYKIPDKIKRELQ